VAEEMHAGRVDDPLSNGLGRSTSRSGFLHFTHINIVRPTKSASSWIPAFCFSIARSSPRMPRRSSGWTSVRCFLFHPNKCMAPSFLRWSTVYT